MPETKVAKNRWHLDISVCAEHLREQADRLTARGGTFLHDGQQGHHHRITLADPEGNEFCIQ